jgi:hypothetical protein
MLCDHVILYKVLKYVSSLHSSSHQTRDLLILITGRHQLKSRASSPLARCFSDCLSSSFFAAPTCLTIYLFFTASNVPNRILLSMMPAARPRKCRCKTQKIGEILK